MKATAIGPSNIAFIKYWGKKDEVLRLPENGSLSMNLSNLFTTTTVEFSKSYTEDYIEINSISESNEGSRAVKHLDRIRSLAKITEKAKVITNNNFPTGTGLSSSASGFAALTVAAAKAAGLELSEKELSILARQGSGSACRSIPDGFVEWLDGNTSDTSFALSIFPPDYFEIVDVVTVVSTDKKFLATSEGQQSARTSPFFEKRLDLIKNKIDRVKKAIEDKNFSEFGELIETEALEFHSILFTSNPPLFYWTPETVRLMKFVQKIRSEGLECYFTINTGQDIHLIVQEKDLNALKDRLKKVAEIKNIIVNSPANGTRVVGSHLF
ncbi:MAG: diphosphomevalonate decarboxylase [Candidatus Levybacteria bacterium RIFCSPLOWO2_12_FULL_39_17]|nr:MAG: Diphosphomevalonate decarboxylase [Candidatus Levybacteria bacterium GW2011_GWA1_39_11]OGH48620.1 MAG: diphosphomevalonate decarboxylase [Candidatus Levybacteria bacterium RIFCSPLOWO2_12_FULL_39_17]